MCSCDYGSAEFYSEDYRKARRPHSCADCGKAIAIGELYIHATQKWEGEVMSHSSCIRCDSLRAGHRAVDPHCNPTLGDLRECMIEAFAELPRAKVRDAALAFRAARLQALEDATKRYAAKLDYLKQRKAALAASVPHQRPTAGEGSHG